MPRAPYHLDSILDVLAANGEMRQGELARATDLGVGTLIAGVKPGIRQGKISVRREGRSVFYRLVDGVPPAKGDEAEGADRDEKASETPPFNAALWADGDLILWNVELNDDGRSLTLSSDQVQMLRRLLLGQGLAE